MKAAVYYGPRDIRIESVPAPPRDRVKSSFECFAARCAAPTNASLRTDRRTLSRPPPRDTKSSGRFPKSAPEWTEDRSRADVVVATVIGCGHCIYCQRKQYNLCDSFTALGYDYAGGFAEYVKIPSAAVAQGNIIQVPAGMSLERAALVEPLSCCLNGQEYLNAQPGDRALVFGAGPIGLMHAAVLKARGCKPVIVTDISDERLSFVEEFGLGKSVNTAGGNAIEKILEAAGGEKFDVALTANSVKSTQADALKLVRKKARVCFFAGIPKDDPVLPIDTNSSTTMRSRFSGASLRTCSTTTRRWR